MTIVFRGDPRTKKNSMRLIRAGARIMALPSAAYQDYETDCLAQLTGDKRKGINCPVNIRCVYYMRTHRRVDLCNLIEATCDILTKGGVIVDDNSSIVAGHDGSRVTYDKNDPRVEIEISWIGGIP